MNNNKKMKEAQENTASILTREIVENQVFKWASAVAGEVYKRKSLLRLAELSREEDADIDDNDDAFTLTQLDFYLRRFLVWE